MQKRNLYLTTTPVEEALAKYFAALDEYLEPQFETIKVVDALGRILKDAVYARTSSPMFNAAAMDGIAVHANDTINARESPPVILSEKNYKVVNTGDPIHTPFDAVIMAEDLIEHENGKIEIRAGADSWQNIRQIGEDIIKGDMLLPPSHKIRPFDMGALLSGGISAIEVYKKPRVAIIPTGGEIVSADKTTYNDGDIIESNGSMLKGMLTVGDAVGNISTVIPDNFDLLRDTIKSAVKQNDMVLIIAGSSAGTEDRTAAVLRELGKIIVHGVAMKPGKPVILAVVENKPVIGIPGYPVAAYLAYRTFAAAVLSRLSGQREETGKRIEAALTKKITSPLKQRHYVQVKIEKIDNTISASPLPNRASAAMSLVRADGFFVIPQNCESVEEGEIVTITLYRPLEEIA